MGRSRENRTRRNAGGFRPECGVRRRGAEPSSRAGAATLDYVLVLGVVLPLVAFIMVIGPQIIRLAYEMVCVLVSWPFM